MLTRLIVDFYAWIIEISLWLLLLISGIAGYYFTVPMLHAAGAVFENEAEWRLYGALFFVVATFLISALVVGPLLSLVDIRKSVRALEKTNSGSENSSGVSTSDDSDRGGASDNDNGTSSKSSGSSSKKGRRLPAELKEPTL